MPVLNPDHLLEQADRLIAPVGGGAPRQADLRRAISAVYYSVFHAVATEAADSFAGRTQRQSPRYALVYRSIDHRFLRGVSEDVIKTTLPTKYVRYQPSGGFGADIVALATAVVDLQEKRHAADYDPLLRVSTAEAILALETGRTAVSRLRHANPTKRRAFLSLVVFSPR